ncbi:shikimate kinase [Thermoflexus sp.]|uniref:shikimate kinase n=1 Tax=Thermoflexus sp. TaxID=1969742 RepID=UPI0025F3EFE7|nr:shikimate kinase [Thermoflexus sp.]MDW8180740.1 shikimate kinase [Anaerolineae bacterium]MCS6962431.1 shikimate kinase [Thermoflexus sp.]MCS7351286.1 shikimate kinase [Thermoflexus sp.]MCX7690931.1 shikimate kinase [Thermoflexus sp.]MDW8185870.1 shikimate kinase [Anaerolineae bacterium]
MPRRNLVITGFVGTGKTTIGRRLAARLGWPFLDFDEEIVRRAGRSIPEIFEQEGEAAFRAMEAALCQEWSSPRGWVLATGGGTCVSPANRAALQAGGHLFFLYAELEEIARRLAEAMDRPLLHLRPGETLLERLRTLWQVREAAYREIPNWVDTTGRSPDEVIEEILRRYWLLE